jgi:DNA-binding NarL/FixJ family response regulator
MFSAEVRLKTKPIRVLVAEDHALVRAGICGLLQRLSSVQVEVVADTGEGLETLHSIKEKKPDIVLLDIAMPGLNGLEIADRVTREFPEIRIIILSMYMNEEYVLRAIHVGASGYLLKNAGIDELELALKSVARGEVYLSPKISKQVLENYVRRLGDKNVSCKTEPFIYERLTSRQREILQLIAEGHTTKQIANRLNVSIKTVDTHRTQLMERLNIHDIAGLVRYAIRTQVVTLE